MIITLQDMLSDPNPMVVANAVAALTDIADTAHRKDVIVITNVILNKLLAALNECTEWGQICILNTLAEYSPVDMKEAESIIERVIPRLSHNNESVVLSAVKCLMVYMNYTTNSELITLIVKKMTPPLGTIVFTVNPILTPLTDAIEILSDHPILNPRDPIRIPPQHQHHSPEAA